MVVTPAQKRVSVLIPVFNGAASIARALSCVTQQSLESLEVIVIDDASTDSTVELVQEIASNEPRIKLIKLSQNMGPGAARTAGLRAAEGEWIAILDADDWIEPDRLERLINEADRDGLDAIADNLALVDPGLGVIIGTAFPLGSEKALDLTIDTYLNNTRPGAKVNLGWMQPLIRRDFLLQNNIEWPDLRHAEDMVFQARVLMAGAKSRLKGEALYHYTQRRGSRSGQVSNLSKTKRSIVQQQMSLDLILADPSAVRLSNWARKRLVRMYREVEATTHVLNMRDTLARGQFIAAGVSGLSALSRPVALARCLMARYLVGNRLR